MTKEELKEHCEKQIRACELWAHSKGEKPSGKVYEEHKLILELLEQETWNLDDAREDFMCDVYNTLNFLPTNNEANRIIDSFDRVTECIEQQPRIKTGHWIDINNHHYYNDGDIETTELRCSCCKEEIEWDIASSHKPCYCENCGAKNG